MAAAGQVGQRLVAGMLRRGGDIEFPADQERLDAAPAQLPERPGCQGGWPSGAAQVVGLRYGQILGPDEDPAGLGKTRRQMHGASN